MCAIVLMLGSFLVYPMQEDVVLIGSPRIELLPEAMSASQGNTTHNTLGNILQNPRVDSLLVEQEAEDDFTHFTSIFTNYYGRPWREVVPFVRIERFLITTDHEVNPYRLTIEDFIAADQPFFYSYDEANRPFIAFLHRVDDLPDYAITLIYLHTVVNCSWLMESTKLGAWDMLERKYRGIIRRDFTELAELLVYGQGLLRDRRCRLLSKEEIMTEAARNSAALQKSQDQDAEELYEKPADELFIAAQEQSISDASLNQQPETSSSHESVKPQEAGSAAQDTKKGKRGFSCLPY